MSKAREFLNSIGESEFNFDMEAVAEAAMGAGGEFSPYRNKVGELTSKDDAVLFLDADGKWWRMKKGKKTEKVNMSKYGRSARDKGKNVRAWDGAEVEPS